MAIVTTYICDISGKQGVQEDFFDIEISCLPCGKNRTQYGATTQKKLVHKEVAEKLHLRTIKDNPNPEPTFESKLSALLKEYVEDIAYEAGQEAASSYLANR